MKTTSPSADLRMRIAALELICLKQEQNIKNTAAAAIDSLKPANLIKNTFNSTVHAPGFGKNIVRGVLGLAAGFLSKKIFVMGSSNVVKKALGSVVELGVAKAVASNAEKITATGIKLLSKATK